MSTWKMRKSWLWGLWSTLWRRLVGHRRFHAKSGLARVGEPGTLEGPVNEQLDDHLAEEAKGEMRLQPESKENQSEAWGG